MGVLIGHAEHRAVQGAFHIDVNIPLFQFLRSGGVGIILHRRAVFHMFHGWVPPYRRTGAIVRLHKNQRQYL